MSDALHASAAALCQAGAYLASRGLTPGTSGNLSLRAGDRILMTPTNASLAGLTPERIAVLDAHGWQISGDPPTKERELHLGMYAARPDARAIVHVHSTYSVALACLSHADPADVLIPLTPYAVMRIGHLPLVPYARPGSDELARAVAQAAAGHHALLLANHGPLVAAKTLASALAVVEEIEEAAKLQVILAGRHVVPLDAAALADLR